MTLTPAERKSAERQRRREAGEVLYQKWVPGHLRDDVAALVEAFIAEKETE